MTLLTLTFFAPNLAGDIYNAALEPSLRIGVLRPAANFIGGPAPPVWRSLFRHSGLAHAFENRLELGAIGRIAARRCPRGAEAGDREGRDESETGLGGGTSLVKAAKLRQGGGHYETYIRKVSVGLD